MYSNIHVPLGTSSYDILIGAGILTDLPTYLGQIKAAPNYVIVTDSNMADLLGEDILKILMDAGLKAELVSFQAGEASKHMDTVVNLARQLVGLGAERQTCLIALGGGVVGDITGFLASIYMRGVPFVQIPTTLLAQVDSSVGGKTGVDLPEGKNLLGTFSQPRLVVADIGVLGTLPASEIRNGLSEVVKYAAIRDVELFDFLEKNVNNVISLEPDACIEVVMRSCQNKADVVVADEKEAGLRRILNFGHTVGHAIETASNYSIFHGEAVSMGMCVAAELSVAKGLLVKDSAVRLKRLLASFGLPFSIPASIATPEKLIALTKSDKKAKAGKVHFVLLKGLGETFITADVSDDELYDAIKACLG